MSKRNQSKIQKVSRLHLIIFVITLFVVSFLWVRPSRANLLEFVGGTVATGLAPFDTLDTTTNDLNVR
ncbi:MAG TPA: hypothetical protein PK299_15895, partial [Anaerolineales bacterium]|nr:hypothetical protein [Anaerolineales bacterium]